VRRLQKLCAKVSQVCIVRILAREHILCIRRLQKLCQGQKGAPHHLRVYLDTTQWTTFNFQVTGPEDSVRIACLLNRAWAQLEASVRGRLEADVVTDGSHIRVQATQLSWDGREILSCDSPRHAVFDCA
jgi:uncharacterized Zn-finger protein